MIELNAFTHEEAAKEGGNALGFDHCVLEEVGGAVAEMLQEYPEADVIEVLDGETGGVVSRHERYV